MLVSCVMKTGVAVVSVLYPTTSLNMVRYDLFDLFDLLELNNFLLKLLRLCVL